MLVVVGIVAVVVVEDVQMEVMVVVVFWLMVAPLEGVVQHWSV